jgi:hypothetical protein
MMRLVLFGTSGCHLCEQAALIIDAYLSGKSDQPVINPIDIAEQAQWQEKYAIRIPVLYHPETQNELGWPFDQTNVEEFINGLSND